MYISRRGEVGLTCKTKCACIYMGPCEVVADDKFIIIQINYCLGPNINSKLLFFFVLLYFFILIFYFFLNFLKHI